MAFATGKTSVEATSIKRYVGVASVNVLAVNPTKAELEKIYDNTMDNEPSYVGEINVDGKNVKNVRIDFIVKTVAEKCNNIDMTSKVSIFVRDSYKYNKDKTKVQVIDKYGRTAWVTIEQAKAHEIPMYSNGPANLDKDYRPAYVGEEELTSFLISYLNIPSVMRYNRDEKKWFMVENPEDSEARLEGIADYFKGNFKELQTVVALQPTNKVKVLFGVRTADNGNQYQAAYTQMFLKNGVSMYDRLEKDVLDRKANGSYPTTEFMLGGSQHLTDLMEYVVEPTKFESSVEGDIPSSDDDPFADL